MQQELDQIIQIGVFNITRLLRNAETSISSGVTDNEDDFEIQNRTQRAPQALGGRAVTFDVDNDIKSRTRGGSSSSKHKTEKAASLSSQFQTAKQLQANSYIRADGADVGVRSGRFGPIRLKPGQRLTDELVKQGLLTKDMLKKLLDELGAENNVKKNSEFEEENDVNNTEGDDDNKKLF